MPRGSGLVSQLMDKRRQLEKAIEEIDAVIRLVHGGKIGGRGRGGARRPMSEEQKAKISKAATLRHAQNRAAKAAPRPKAKVHTRPKAINRPAPRPRPKVDSQEMEAEV